MNRSFSTSMEFSAPIRILIIFSMVLLFQSPSYADPAEGQNRDASILSQQNTPMSGDSTVPGSPEIKAQLSSGGEGSVPGSSRTQGQIRKRSTDRGKTLISRRRAREETRRWKKEKIHLPADVSPRTFPGLPRRPYSRCLHSALRSETIDRVPARSACCDF